MEIVFNCSGAACENEELLNKYKSQLQAKDALIKELIECVEFYGDSENISVGDFYYDDFCTVTKFAGKKARTLLNSEAVKEWRGEK